MRPISKREDRIKIDLEETGCESLDWIQLTQRIGPNGGFFWES